MFRKWLRGHLSLVISATSGAVIAALVATVALVSTGYTAQKVDLGDGSVWVANAQQQAIGRANTEVLELNSVVSTTSDDLDVVQSGQVVLLFDRSGNKVDIVDAATSTSSESVALPPSRPEVFLAGTNVIVFEAGTGELWIVPWNDFSHFDAEADSTLSLGSGAVVTVDPSGLLFAYSPSTGQVLRVDAAVSDVVTGSEAADIPAGGDYSITSVAGRWAVLDSDTDTVYLQGRTAGLAPLIGGGSGAALQWASASGDRVLVSYSAGLLSIPLSGAAPVALVDGQSGTSTRPLVVDGCEYAAWSGGDSWRRCAGDGSGTTRQLDDMQPTARLSFVTNGDRAVLNDRRSGATWAVQREGELIDNWDELIVTDDTPPQEQPNDEDVPPEVEKVQEPPVAIDDAFGARPGRASVLPVLLNDFDPNGDVLIVSGVTPLDESIGRLDLINSQQQVQITLAAGATGSVSFDYTITDGRGGSATATVVVTVRSASENSPPVQVRSTKAVVQTGGRVTTQVLGDWVDPDGDAFYLTNASAPEPDRVSYKPGGAVVYSDAGAGGDVKTVSLVVSDGTAESSGTLSVTVRAAGDIPIVADPFVVLASAGEEVTVSPLDHVRGGTGVVRLNSVPAKTDVTITPSYETGTFTFQTDQIRSHYLEYVVTDGDQTVTGLVRIDVTSPPDPNTKPITVPKTVFVKPLRNERVDVAGTDVDPAGGVLLVTGISNLASDSGVRAEILDQRLVRVSLTGPLDDGPVTFNYRITNGLADAEGVITVVEIPNPERVQAPIANDDTVTVRVGEAIDIPVLDNDEHPDGLDLTLQPKLDQELPEGSGLLFASGRVLRYLAPDKTGNFTAAYQVTGPDGQAATALVRIAVREADPSTNNPPVPKTVTARVIAGETVRIRVPLTGIDPDGDAVQLIGQSTNPQKGAVTSVESDTIVYQAGDYSAGTDSFTYTVIDSLGARSTGTVRVGISPRLEGARNPVAIADAVTVRPGFTVSVQALANDSDPDGSPLTIVSATPADASTALTATVVGTDVVDITPPRAEGTYAVIYQIENDRGGTSQNFIRVTVDANAPLSYPVASDSVLTLSDVLDRDRVTVDVLANVFFADGDARSLGLSVYSGFGGAARVTNDKKIEVTVGNKAQIIPFKVTHPEDPTVFTYAFIRVPGYNDALPQLDRRAPALKVNSEDQLVIDLNDYVIAVGGKQVRLTDSSTVQATHANGDDLVVDQDTLVFTSADKYFGPASISFEVTDGSSASDPAGRKAILVLPITVLPRDNQPPVFGGAVIDFEPGQAKEIDLLKLTTYPYPNDLDELQYSVLTTPEGFTYELVGNVLKLTADEKAAKGSVATMTLGVKDSVSDGGAGRIELHVVASTRPLLVPAPDSGVAKRGGTTSIDVLANDEATNPFPGKPLRVLAIRGLDGASLPAGLDIVPSADNSRLAVTVASSTLPTDVTLQYQVADATNDPSRYVWGSITISVQDRPDPVTNLAPSGFSDRQITMRWNAGSFNNSPITNYKVTSTQGSTTVDVTNCTGTTCTIPTPGNGPSNAVTVTVVATNAIGDSDAVTLSDPVWSDIIPPAPTALSSSPIDRGLILSWNAVSTPSGGSAVDRYHLAVGGYSGDVSPSSCSGGTCSVSTASLGWSFDNGVAVTYTVSARNAALTALSVWNTSEPASGVPAGPPIAVASPSATVQSDTSVSLGWADVFSANGRPITAYTAAAYSGTAPTCSPSGAITSNGAYLSAAGTSTSTTFTGLSANATYTLVVFAYNGQGCTMSSGVVAHTPPPVISNLTVSGPSANGSTYDFVFTGGTAGGTTLGSADSLYYRLNGGSEYGPVSLNGFIAADTTQYGQEVSITARACRTYDGIPVCQTVASSPQSLGVPVDPRLTGLTFVSDGNALSPWSGTFSWLGAPSGAGYTSVEYACGTSAGGTFSPAAGVSSCHVDAGLLSDAYLTIRVGANGTTYDITYRASQL